jgi:tetraacyldisaccharide 4'-kinase
MRGALERLARRWWAGDLGLAGSALTAATAPMSWAWAWAARRRARRFALRGGERIEGLTVVSVGNLAVGGTGKTPVVGWVAARLAAVGVPTIVLTGAHGADEALLHALWSAEIPAVSGRDRVATAARARADGARAVVLDDGFQHLRLARDFDIVLLSADDRFPAPVLPGGPYREPPGALGRAHAVVVTRRVATEDAARALAAEVRPYAPDAVSAGVWLAPSRLRGLAEWTGAPGGAAAHGAGELGGRPVLGVCGVARPDAFAATVGGLVGGPVELLAFGDHHAYTRADVARVCSRAAGRPIVVTAKDAVKLTRWEEELSDVYVLEEELRWAWGEEALAAPIEALVAEGAGR